MTFLSRLIPTFVLAWPSDIGRLRQPDTAHFLRALKLFGWCP